MITIHMSQPINISFARLAVQGDRDLYKSLMEMFICTYPQQVDDINDSIKKGDTLSLFHQSHKIKGALKSICADRAADCALKLEKMARNSINKKLPVFRRHRAGKILSQLKSNIGEIAQYYQSRQWFSDF